MKLYEIANEIMDLMNIEPEGDKSLEEAISNSLDDLNMEFDIKTDNIVKLSQSIDNNILAVKNEITRLTERKKALENKNSGLLNYLLEEMDKAGIHKIDSDLFTVSIRKGRNSVFIDSMENLPIEYIVTKVTDSPDKKALAVALKEDDVPGAHFERGKSTLSIK